MARMLPEFPRNLSADSLENVMFEALERLPEEYFVVHSFRLVKGNRYENELSDPDGIQVFSF